jgi:hypothetical protein
MARDRDVAAFGERAMLLAPTLLAGRRGKARTRRRATQLVTAAGLRSVQWHRLYAVIIQAVTATKYSMRTGWHGRGEVRLASSGSARDRGGHRPARH